MKNSFIIGGGKEEKITKEITNEILDKKFQTEIGQKAIVQREDIQNDRTEDLRGVLSDIGKNFAEVGAVPKGMEYCGSAAVHIFRAPTLGHVAYVNQLALSSCSEVLAGPAISDLRGAMMNFYGRARQKKRSGF